MKQTRTGGRVFIEAFLQVPRDVSDIVTSFICDNFAAGVVLEGEDDDEVQGIRFYVSPEHQESYKTHLNAYLAQLELFRNAELPHITEQQLTDELWEQKYRESMTVVQVVPDVTVRPPWLDPPANSVYDIVIEPKMAFGTGRHETTVSCLEAVRTRFEPGMRLLDVGCGSGILAILAAKMGAAYVKAVDHDLAAVENATENFELNDVTCPYDILFGSVEKAEKDTPYDFVVANIIKSVLFEMLDQLTAVTAQSGILVLSGLLDKEEAEVLQVLGGVGMASKCSVQANNEWRTFICRHD